MQQVGKVILDVMLHWCFQEMTSEMPLDILRVKILGDMLSSLPAQKGKVPGAT